jgi:hypothetical protein
MNYSQDKVAQMLIKTTENTLKIVLKTQTWANENNIEETVLLNAKLAPDMFSFSKQIQIVSDNLKGILSRMAMIDAPVMEDSETTLSELIQRLEKTLEYAKSIGVDSLNSSENQKIILPFMPTKFLETEDYLFGFAIPNFYFHTSAIYCIVRNLGVSVGKMDFIGSLNLQGLN